MNKVTIKLVILTVQTAEVIKIETEWNVLSSFVFNHYLDPVKGKIVNQISSTAIHR